MIEDYISAKSVTDSMQIKICGKWRDIKKVRYVVGNYFAYIELIGLDTIRYFAENPVQVRY